jgi:ATP-dependent Clp protease protease subunit
MPTPEAIASAVAATLPTFARGWYAVNLKKGTDEAEISIYDAIGAYGITAEAFIAELEAITAKTINLRINTPGGEVFDATAIYNALLAHPAEILVHIEGVAASAGSYIAMSGDEVRMADNAYLMMHNAHGGVMGEAEDMRKYADVLDKMNANIAVMYDRKSAKGVDHWRELMDAETWFTAEEAAAEGLVDVVYTAGKKTAPAKASFDFTIYNKIPEPVKNFWGIKQASKPNESISQPEGLEGPRIVASPPAAVSIQESIAMATDSTVSTAPSEKPLVAEVTTPSGPLGTFATVQEAIANFKSVQGPQFFEQGRKKGGEEAVHAYNERVKAIADACPGKPEMALNAILTGQSAEAVGLAYNATMKAEEKARVDAEAKDLTILRLEALLATGGHPGVGMGMAPATGDDAHEYRREPKAQAEWEWENQPLVRKTARSKEVYILARTAELDGTHRSFSREPVNA